MSTEHDIETFVFENEELQGKGGFGPLFDWNSLEIAFWNMCKEHAGGGFKLFLHGHNR